jgi:tetrahydromethanopterin S-methyltransferase subunit G
MSTPEIQRQVRQQRADIDSLYELLESVDQKVDAGFADVSERFAAADERFDGLDSKLDAILELLRER